MAWATGTPGWTSWSLVSRRAGAVVENGDAVDKLRIFLAETDSDRRNLSPDQPAELRELVGLGHCARVGGEDLLLEDVALRHVLGVLALEPLHGHNLAICE
jgi:hypothetical protein